MVRSILPKALFVLFLIIFRLFPGFLLMILGLSFVILNFELLM